MEDESGTETRWERNCEIPRVQRKVQNSVARHFRKYPDKNSLGKIIGKSFYKIFLSHAAHKKIQHIKIFSKFNVLYIGKFLLAYRAKEWLLSGKFHLAF